MGRNVLVYFGKACGFFDGLSKAGFVQMVALFDARVRVGRDTACGEDVLPYPFFAGVGVFFRQGGRQVDAAVTCAQVFLVECFDVSEL